MKFYEVTTIFIIIFISLGILIGVGNSVYEACKCEDVEETQCEKKNE